MRIVSLLPIPQMISLELVPRRLSLNSVKVSQSTFQPSGDSSTMMGRGRFRSPPPIWKMQWGGPVWGALSCRMRPIFATLNGPKHLCFDHDGSVLIADTENHVIRRYVPGEEMVVRVAGTGVRGSGGVGGAADACELDRPHGAQRHPRTGYLYISDSENHRVLRAP